MTRFTTVEAVMEYGDFQSFAFHKRQNLDIPIAAIQSVMQRALGEAYLAGYRKGQADAAVDGAGAGELDCPIEARDAGYLPLGEVADAPDSD